MGKNKSKSRVNFNIGDYVIFHTKHGKTTGIIEEIYLRNPQIALITTRSFSFRAKQYKRPLFKLKHIS